MGSARIGRERLGGMAVEMDTEGALIAFADSLGGYRHPLPTVARMHVLAIATGIAARAPASLCTDVTGRLRTILRRHGILLNDLRPR